jgi:cellulose synthase/poly-beta-1,6-N-acetylglucosamine synthase-like glycosyltransferase
MTDLWYALFWSSVAVVIYATLGWPLALALRALFPAPAPRPASTAWPRVSYLIVAHNERAQVDAKLANTDALDYPADRLEVIFASDGSDDGTDARVSELWRGAVGGPQRRLLSLPRIGKNAAMNAAAEAATGEILVFSDADSHLAPDAIRRLVLPLTDPAIGAAGGDFRYSGSGGDGERAYWSVDRLWKRLECRAGSMTSATGQIYAIRTELFQPVPDGVTDDFFVSTGAVAAGRRLWFAEDAVATGPVGSSAPAEFRRKVRVTARGLASVWERRALLKPRRHGFFALQLFTHKVLRRALGLPVALAFASAVALAPIDPRYAAAAVAQALLHGAALAGWLLRDRTVGRAFALPLYVDLVLIAGLLAILDVARGRRHRSWVPDRSPALPAAPIAGGS